jgi:hypothetical protein
MPIGVARANIYRSRLSYDPPFFQNPQGPYFYVGTVAYSAVEQSFVDSVDYTTILTQRRTAPQPILIPLAYGMVISAPTETQFSEFNDGSLPPAGIASVCEYADRLWGAVPVVGPYIVTGSALPGQPGSAEAAM